MKKLLLMRHADALTLDFLNDDFHRILSPIGNKQALDAGKFISKNFIIDRVLTSPSSRTLQTISAIMKECGITEELSEIPIDSKEIIHVLYENKDMPLKLIEAHNQLYRSSFGTILELISKQQASEQTLMILGHNPEIFKVALELSDRQNDVYDKLILNGMTTAMIVVLEFADLAEWQDIEESSGTITGIFAGG